MHGMKWLRGALVLPKSLSSSVTWLLLLGLAVAWAACGPAVLVNAQDSFISIDCGTSEENHSGSILWYPDSNYTVLGSAANVTNATLPYDTLRYFPNKAINKSCYVFNTTANLPYLVRAGFLYGNYDNLSGLPSFDLLFDANLWTNVSFKDVNEIVSHEMIVLAMGENTSVCVARSNTDHDPFISSLEIRPLSTNVNMYSPVHQNFLMKTNSRINFGQNNTDSLRYPDDEYDRIWDSDLKVITGISMYSPISTNNSVASSLDSPPSKVMQTARSGNKTENMTFDFFANFGPGKYYLAFYFAEIVTNESQRIMDIYIDEQLSRGDLNMSSPAGLFSTIEIYNANYTVTGESYKLRLMPSKNSSSGPIINAAESYFLQRGDQGTLDLDVQALENIKTAFNLSLWTGDPCLPNASKWSWLDCNSSASPARVIALDLSSRGLRSEIPSGMGNLTALTSVDLHNNSLFGHIPSFLERLNLTFLDLSNNNLSGEYPSGFSNHTNVSITGNPLLCFNTSCEVTPVPTPAPLLAPASSSAKDTGLIVGLVLAGFLVLVMVVLGLTLYRRKSRKKQKLFMTNSAHWPPVPPFTEVSRAGDSVVSARKEGSNDAPIYSFADMQIITNNFEKKLTAGSFGSLFYGTLSGGQEVVVKLLQSNIQQSPNDFLKKVSHLSYVNHRNLLRPTGFCAESHRFMFVYEHVQKGSLYDHLYNNQCLDWRTRLNILQQVAQGLEYLHCECTPSIVHGNLKSTNVLMSGDGMLAKVSDFGIYELSPNVDATSGYLDPEYFAIKKLTEKSDVYSFGVLILEVMCGRVPFDTSLPKEAWNIVDWVRNALHEGNYELIADPGLHSSYNMIALSKVAQLALQATEVNINERPTIGEIIMELKEANKIELGHHVAFAELATGDFSNSSDFPLPSTCPNVLCEADVSD